MQAVHGWLSTYERLVNSQNFFSPYLTQEDKSRLGRFVGIMDDKTMKRVDKAVLISLGLDYLGKLQNEK